jgi:hypothetical protein
MTDARLAPSFLTNPTVEGLSSDAFRVYVNGLVWSATHRTDGALPERCLRLLHPDGPQREAVADLLAVGLWQLAVDGYLIRNFLKYQSSAEQLADADVTRAEKRRADRERQRLSRARRKAGAVTPAVTRDVTADVATVRLGQDSDSDRDRKDRHDEPPTAEEAAWSECAVEDVPDRFSEFDVDRARRS